MHGALVAGGYENLIISQHAHRYCGTFSLRSTHTAVPFPRRFPANDDVLLITIDIAK